MKQAFTQPIIVLDSTEKRGIVWPLKLFFENENLLDRNRWLN